MAGLKHLHEEELVRNRGFSSRWAYQKYLVGLDGHDSYKSYLEGILLSQEIGSLQDYKVRRTNMRMEMTLNKKFGYLIKQRLGELGLSLKWLADQVGVSARTIKRYKRGEFLPKAQLAAKLFNALGVPYKTIDDLVSAEQKSL